MKIQYLLPFFLLTFSLAHDPKAAPQDNENGGTSRQIRFYEQRLARNSEDTIALARLGKLELELARAKGTHEYFARAENRFRNLLAIDGNHVAARLGLSRALLGQHRFTEALQQARIGGDLKPGSQENIALIGDIHFALGNYQEAAVMFGALLAGGPDLGRLARLAQMAEARGRLDETERLYREALATGMENDVDGGQLAWCHTMIGDLMLKTNRLAAAREHFTKAITMAGRLDYASWRLAELDVLAGKENVAMERLHHLIHDPRPKPTYLFAYARLVRNAGEKASAEPWFNRGEREILTEIDRGELGHIRELAMAYLEMKRNLPAALELAQKDLAEVRHDSEAYELVGWALHLLGKDDLAVAYMDDALRPGLANARTILRAGIVNHMANRKIRAVHLLRIGLSSGQLVDPELRTEAERLAAHLQAYPAQLRSLLRQPKSRPGR